MKKNLKLALGVVAICLAASFARARVVGTAPTNPDSWCTNGGAGNAGSSVTGAEICVDYSGNLVPTVTSTQTLGSSTLPFASVYSVSATVTGSDSSGTAGTMNAAGTSGTAATQSTTAGLQVFAESDVFFINASTTIPVNTSYLLLMSSAATVTLTSKPSISTTTVVGGSTLLPSGSFLILSSSTTLNNVVLSSSGTLAGSGLVLGAPTRTISRHKVLTLILDTNQNPALWREISYSNN